ncbi:MAG TPA: NCS2 family permease [Candidatus Udaeobacter sp.]|jgi:AGZA family xanthine/uracil permease-like MFS transporter|nr:NCS2 family permease [Candidatus Udaeobacter sp.]
MLERWFKLSENKTNVRTEVLAGVTTFLTMAYIIFVQPAVLSGKMFGAETGMDFGAVTTATCLSAALATAIMAIYARYPIAQAPGMGENFFFVFSAIPAATAAGFANGWQVALGVVFVSGVLFLVLSLIGLRELIFNSVSPSMKNGIAAGIGIFIAFIGLQQAGIIIKDPASAVKLNTHFASPDSVVFFVGLLTTAVLHARRARGSILLGIVVATAFACFLKVALTAIPAFTSVMQDVPQSMLASRFEFAKGLIALPPSLAPTFMKMDLPHALTAKMLPLVFVFLFMLTFDAIGTLIGVCEQAGFMRNNKLPRAKQAMVSDAIGTVAGAGLGTSTVTSFIESAAGVEAGGRTGLTGLVVAALFLFAVFFSPLIAMIGAYPPIAAAALTIVGAMMMQNVSKIEWTDYSESIPAFLIVIGIPLSYSIADGLALGFISYAAIKVCGGRGREISWLTYVLALVLVLYFVFVRSRMG